LLFAVSVVEPPLFYAAVPITGVLTPRRRLVIGNEDQLSRPQQGLVYKSWQGTGIVSPMFCGLDRVASRWVDSHRGLSVGGGPFLSKIHSCDEINAHA